MKPKKTFNYARFGYIFSIPFVIAWLIFSLYPICYTIFIGFTDLQGAGASTAHVLWGDIFKNFKSILDNNTFKTAFGNTFLLWGCNFVPQLGLALLIAAWFTDNRNKIKGQGLFKVLFYMPNIITAATIAILFSAFFGYPKGPVNDLLMMFGIIHEPYYFLQQKFWARAVIIFIQTWMWYGYTSIVLISGVLGISPEIFEAAEVDGANSFKKFWLITIPNIKSILLFTLVTSLIGGLQMFDIPYLFLGGKPDNSTLTTSVFIYNQAFGPKAMYNRAAAASVLMFFIICILSAIIFFMLRDKDEVEMRKIVREQERKYKQKLKEEKMLQKGGM